MQFYKKVYNLYTSLLYELVWYGKIYMCHKCINMTLLHTAYSLVMQWEKCSLYIYADEIVYKSCLTEKNGLTVNNNSHTLFYGYRQKMAIKLLSWCQHAISFKLICLIILPGGSNVNFFIWNSLRYIWEYMYISDNREWSYTVQEMIAVCM